MNVIAEASHRAGASRSSIALTPTRPRNDGHQRGERGRNRRWLLQWRSVVANIKMNYDLMAFSAIMPAAYSAAFVETIQASLAIKPTSSIRTPGKSIDRAGRPIEVVTTGRHDPCVGIRATPIAEAMLALVLIDPLPLECGVHSGRQSCRRASVNEDEPGR